ncbi:hypothetical protein DVH05_000254 [Phytophthora capsici]|nr:hypothetical protein DVH05_000254 [Phytophthora capsici]
MVDAEEATITSSVILSKPVVLSGSVESSEDVTQSQSEHEIESSDVEMSADSEKRPPVRHRWMISKTTNKSGRVKISAATRKKAVNSSLNQSARFVEAVASGLDPSVGGLLEEVQVGITYRQVETLRSLTVVQQTRNTKITVFERRNKPETNAYKLRTVLPLRRIEPCEAQVAQFQNRWFSDHETRMLQMGVTVQTGGVVYDMKLLKAMRSWHTTISWFDGIEKAIKWVEHKMNRYGAQTTKFGMK